MAYITFKEAKEIYAEHTSYKDWVKAVEAMGKEYYPQQWFDAAEATILEKEMKEEELKGGQ